MNREKIHTMLSTPGQLLAPADLTADEKKRLYALFTAMGASDAFAYTRFFRDGFAEWELQGIWQCKIDYLDLLHCEENIDITFRAASFSSVEGAVSAAAPVVGNADPYRGGAGATTTYLAHYTADGEEKHFDLLTPGDFWRMLGDTRHRWHFGEYMQQLGMLSYTTVSKRFASDDWRDYELHGIRNVMEEFLSTTDDIEKTQ